MDAAIMPLFRCQRQLQALAYNLGNFLRTLATPESIKPNCWGMSVRTVTDTIDQCSSSQSVVHRSRHSTNAGENVESRTIRYGVTAFTALLLGFSGSARTEQSNVHDLGVRDDLAPGAGNSYPHLSDPFPKLFDAGLEEFEKPHQVKDGLGPRMNLNSCSGCHANPALGGSSPEINPQFVFFNASDGVNHNTNKLPSFITEKGPTREARFPKFRSPTRTGADGGVHNLFTIAGMKGAEGCKLKQDNFEEELRNKNVTFRIPTPVFGAGLIELIPDTAIIANIRLTGIRSTLWESKTN